MAEHALFFSRSEAHLEHHSSHPYTIFPDNVEVKVRGWVGLTYEHLRIDPDIYSDDHLAHWDAKNGTWVVTSDALEDQGLRPGHVFSDVTIINDFGELGADQSSQSIPELGVATEDADPSDVEHVLSQSTEGDDGRSEWQWFRLPNGDLILGCFPQGSTYFDVTDSIGV